MLVLSARELEHVLPPAEAISAMEEAFRLPAGAFEAPARSRLAAAGGTATFFVMPSHAAALGFAGVKLVAVVPGNPARGLDTVQSAYLLASAGDGRPAALLDGKYLTGIRTAAVSALATRLLAPERPARLALFGTGAQARFHLEALPAVRAIVEARVVGSSRAKAEAFARAMQPRTPFPLRASDPDEAAAAADIVCACTTSRVPVCSGAALRPGAHVNAVGAFQPDARELDDAAVANARIVVDTLEGALSEAGDLLIPLASGALRRSGIAGDLGQLARGEIEGRLRPDEITVFKSVGFALEDLAAAVRAFRRAAALGVGREVEISP